MHLPLKPAIPALLITGMFALLSMFGCGGDSDVADYYDPEEIVEKYIAALSEGDMNAIAACWGVEPEELSRTVGSGIHTEYHILDLEMLPTSEYSAIVTAEYINLDQADGLITTEDHFRYQYDLINYPGLKPEGF